MRRHDDWCHVMDGANHRDTSPGKDAGRRRKHDVGTGTRRSKACAGQTPDPVTPQPVAGKRFEATGALDAVGVVGSAWACEQEELVVFLRGDLLELCNQTPGIYV